MKTFLEYFKSNLENWEFPYSNLKFNRIFDSYIADNCDFYSRKTALCRSFLGEPDDKGQYTIGQFKYELHQKSHHCFINEKYGIKESRYFYGGITLETYIWLSSINLDEEYTKFQNYIEELTKSIRDKRDVIKNYPFAKKYNIDIELNYNYAIVSGEGKKKGFDLYFKPYQLLEADEALFKQIDDNFEYLSSWMSRETIQFNYKNRSFII